ncbi:type VII secretion protein EccB [Streptomyces sp. NBC_01320]|uniref:type VII secretion protein EccB n=1 Tax=Streptomyces sp. NBC_01320 TaxID=2903824 RepID=UPI002E1071A6|nr:type VII secretion protein EccB [Streptomyces sp. NBC_01320]
MQNKRDQVQAHMFVMGRLASAMLRAEPDAPESPSGRTNRATALSVIIALILCAGAFVFGLLKPGGNTSWRTSDALIVSKETGTRFVYLNGRLRPVRNYASALLLANGNLKTTTVGDNSLRGEPHGSPVGIPGAPDTLPGAGDVNSGPWLVCSGLEPGSGGAVSATTVLAVGSPDPGSAGGGQELGGKESVLVLGPDKTAYLVWQGSRLRLDDKADAAKALGYGSVTPRPVSASFLNALPAGPDLASPEVSGRGDAGPDLGGRKTRIGQVFQVDVPGAAPRYHLLTKDGLVPLTATGAALVLGDPRTRATAYAGGVVTVARLGADALTGHLASASTVERAGAGALPEAPPKAVDVAAGSVACTGISAAGDSPRTSTLVLPQEAVGLAAQPPSDEVEPACLDVDAITVRAGKGALVRALGAAGNVLGDTTYLVTDSGVKYWLPSQEAVKALGYEGTRPQALPAPLLAMLPTGPDLDPESASTGGHVFSMRCKTDK